MESLLQELAGEKDEVKAGGEKPPRKSRLQQPLPASSSFAWLIMGCVGPQKGP